MLSKQTSEYLPQSSATPAALVEVPLDPSFIETRLQRIGTSSLALDVIGDMDRAHQYLLSRRKHELKNWGENDIFPHFGVIWPSALALANIITKSIDGQKNPIGCLELGCGLAIPSLLIKKAFPSYKITATDRHPWVPTFLKRNLKKNQLEIDYHPLEWRAIDSDKSRYPWLDLKSYDLVIGSDLLYYPWQPRALARTLALLLKPDGGRALIADPGRRYLDEFRTQALAQGLILAHEEEHPVEWNQEKAPITVIHLVASTGT